MCFQETVENVKKCRNFLSTLIKLASDGKQSSETTANVKELVKNLLVLFSPSITFFFPSSVSSLYLSHYVKTGLCVNLFLILLVIPVCLFSEFVFSCTDPLSVFIIQQEGKIEPQDFTSSLYRELNSSPQPYLVPFLNVRSVIHHHICRITVWCYIDVTLFSKL